MQHFHVDPTCHVTASTTLSSNVTSMLAAPSQFPLPPRKPQKAAIIPLVPPATGAAIATAAYGDPLDGQQQQPSARHSVTPAPSTVDSIYHHAKDVDNASSFCLSSAGVTPSESPAATPMTNTPVNPAPIQRPTEADIAWDILHMLLSRYIQRTLMTCNYANTLYHIHPEEARELAEEETQAIAGINPSLVTFFAVCVPPMTLEQYIHRLMTYCRCSKECHLLAVRYMERLSIAGLPITPRSVHRVYMTCLLLAIKYRDDHMFPTSYYAQCGGVRPKELTKMELNCFVLLGYDCGLTDEEYQELAIEVAFA